MLSAPSSSARRDITVNMVVPTSGNLLLKCKVSGLQVLQAAGKGTHGQSAFAQFARCRQAALSRGAHQQELPPRGEQAGLRQQGGHGDVPRRGRTRRHFLPGANVDHLKAASRRVVQGVKGDFNLRILWGDGADLSALRSMTLGASRRLELQSGEVREIQQPEFAFELPG